MPKQERRPAGITLIALLIAINGIVSLVEAFEVAARAGGGTILAVISGLIALALFYRAYGIWSLERRFWLITVLILCAKAVFEIASLIAEPQKVTPALNLVLVCLALLYLTRPSTRAVFGIRSGR